MFIPHLFNAIKQNFHLSYITKYSVLTLLQTQFEALENRLVLDAGCGTGTLSLGAAMLGAGVVTAVDIDEDALEVFRDNVDIKDLTNINAVQCDFLNADLWR